MYEEGDDDLKRTIRKAWHEGQNKKNTAEMPSLDDMTPTAPSSIFAARGFISGLCFSADKNQ
ncbi:hypothetical protein NECAME_15312 [Necator americanus]|uniref:Uncharacterized protein n=1 Tax=Necator americanus TaxID=51031 RepID=W2SKQ6_NECAM|nr:hypothetical protein NECAME_15312 [Necator americanus]ETN69441.1 hypothetical protein NECAME_15312 [Necator americanus]